MRSFVQASALALAMMSPAVAFAAAQAPAGSTPEQQEMVLDWARYSTACRGGAEDGTQASTFEYCGAAQYISLQLNKDGICFDPEADNFFRACRADEAMPDPLENYPF